MKNYKKLSKKEKEKLLKNTTFVNCICEICLNMVKRVIPLKTDQKRKLRRHSNIIRKLVRKVKTNKNLKHKKKLLQQGGGVFLPLLFSVVGPLLSKLLAGNHA